MGRPGFRLNSCSPYRSAESDVDGYADRERRRPRDWASHSCDLLQVTNEVNASLGIGASDGTQPGARSALVRGVIAAHAAMRIAGIDDRLKWGSAWRLPAIQLPQNSGEISAGEGAIRFTEAVDWVGVDLIRARGVRIWTRGLSREAAGICSDALRHMRQDWLPQAGLDRRWPCTCPKPATRRDGRSEQTQARVAQALVRAVSAARGAFGVTDFRWFDLRDADSSTSSIEAHYGLTRDDGSHKLAFEVFLVLITRYGPSPVRDDWWLAIARSAAAFRTPLVACTREGANSMSSERLGVIGVG